MPPDRYSSKDMFDIEILDPQALHASDGLKTALRAIESVCYRGDSEIAEMVEMLNSRSYLLEYIISGMLRMPVGLCALLALIVPPSSFGGGGIREVLEVDSYGISYIRGAKHERHEYTAPPEIFIFAAVREVHIHCPHTPQPPCIREKSGTFVRYSRES